MDKLKILVCCHKADPNIRTQKPYLPIQVGKAIHPDLDLGFICDNTGDNISEKNPSFCEYTALYWGWKNLKDVEYCGLCHYRRYFDLDINENNIDSLLSASDILVIKQNSPMLSKKERLNNLVWVTSAEDAYIYLDTVLSMYPQYKQEIIDYFYDSKLSIPFSMFIASKKIYDEYCEFIFPVLFEVEKKMKPHGYARQKRAIGYFGEFSLGLFIMCKKLKYRAIPMKSFGSARGGQIHQSIKSAIKWQIRKFLWTLLDRLDKEPTYLTCGDANKVGFKQDGIELKVLK